MTNNFVKINEIIKTITKDDDMYKFSRPESAGAYGGFSEQITPGEYPARFISHSDCKIPVYMKQDEFQDGICFTYEIDIEGGPPVKVDRRVRSVITAAKPGRASSHFYKDLSGMYGGDIPKEILLNDVALVALMDSFKAKTFTILVGQKQSANGENYSKFLSVSKPVPKGRAVVKPAQININNDDVPF